MSPISPPTISDMSLISDILFTFVSYAELRRALLPEG